MLLNGHLVNSLKYLVIVFYLNYVIQKINDNWSTFSERMPKLPSVDGLPEVESVGSDGHLEYVGTPTAAEIAHAQKYIEAANGGNCEADLD